MLCRDHTPGGHVSELSYFADVSHYNAIADANAVRANGITGVWCKATEGASYVDPTFLSKVNQLRAAGLLVGAYHFSDGSDPAKQAAHFRTVAGDAGCLKLGALPPMNDMESEAARANANGIIPAFYDAVAVTPQDVYGNLDWWQHTFDRSRWGTRALLGHIARYNGKPGEPGFTAQELALHQHTDFGTIPGIPGAVDRDSTIPPYTLAQILVGGAVPETPPAKPAAPTTPTTTTTWAVRSGDTLSRIASAWHVTVSALAAANGIADPDLIRIGELIHRPGSAGAGPTPVASGATYMVRSGDTLSEIAATRGTSVPVLVSLNHLSNPDRIYQGQVLHLPTTRAGTPPAARVYIVRSGDTLSAIAAHLGYPGGYPALAARNAIRGPSYTIIPGQQIFY
jgi:LysM repeat protein